MVVFHTILVPRLHSLQLKGGQCAWAEHKTSVTPHKKDKYYDNHIANMLCSFLWHTSILQVMEVWHRPGNKAAL